MSTTIRRSRKILSAKKIAQLSRLAEEIDRTERPAIIARGRKVKRYYDEIRELLVQLKSVRQEAGIALEEMARRSGIGKANLSRLERGRNPNPTVATLERYAHALGKRLTISLVDQD